MGNGNLYVCCAMYIYMTHIKWGGLCFVLCVIKKRYDIHSVYIMYRDI